MSSIEVRCGGKVHTVQVNDNETLLAALRKAGFSVPAACGGRAGWTSTSSGCSDRPCSDMCARRWIS